MKTDNDDGKETGPVLENVYHSAFPKGDIILVVEGKELYVNSQILKQASPVFKTMLESEFKEKGQTRIDLPGKTYDAMVEFLKCTYPFINAAITVDNVLLILPLADEYQTDLKSKCEEFIIKCLKGNNKTGDTLDMFYEPDFGKAGFDVNSDIDVSNHKLISYIVAAETHGLERLLIVAIKYMSMRNYSNYEKVDDFIHISTETRMKVLLVRMRMLEQTALEKKSSYYGDLYYRDYKDLVIGHLVRT